MRWIFTLALAFLSLYPIQAQNAERVVSGRLTSQDDGSPLPGVNITIKGTVRGTVTDVDGRYSLSVPIGSVLVFSFIGMQTTEVLVTETSLKSINTARANKIKVPNARSIWSNSILQDTTKVREGVVVLNDQSPTYKLFTNALNPQYISAIRKTLRFPGVQPVYSIYTNTDDIKHGLHGQFSTSFGTETATRFPKLQQKYAQGRSVNQQAEWQGADAGEIFSWGPAIKTLEYDGSHYDYDTRGRLVFAGQGNGQMLKTVNPLQFFNQGFSVANELLLTTPGIRSSTIQLDGYRKSHTGIIPGNSLLTHGITAKVRGFRLGEQTKVNASVFYNTNQGNLLPRGANLAAIMGAVYLTPPSFDNTNQTRGLENKLAYRLVDGSVRSAAPGLLNNPFGLAKEFPDRENSRRILANVSIQFAREKPLNFVISGGFDQQNGTIVHGVSPGWSGYLPGRRTHRGETQRNVNAAFVGEYRWPGFNELKLNWSYEFRNETRSVNRTDGFGFTTSNFNSIQAADSLVRWNYSLGRSTHEVNLKVNYDAGFGDFTIGNRNYFSSTYPANRYVNLFPFASVKFNLDDWVWNPSIKPFASYARSIRENPLVQQNLAPLSLLRSMEQYAGYFENMELFFQQGVGPEIENKLEAGIQVDAHRFDINASFYSNNTTNLILPTWQLGALQLQNAAAIRNTGVNLNARYNQYFRGHTFQVSLRFTHYKTLVTDVYGATNSIPIAGFHEVFTVARKGDALGTIFGSTWLRDDQDRKVIGADGFPLVDLQPKKIGNPIPDYVLAFDANVSIKRLRAGFVLEYRNGGEVWNGTRAALDYHGRSIETASKRQVNNYVFDGVTQGGTVNTTAVQFYDVAQVVSENRWVRYGFTGVAEDYVEDASWLRLSEVNVSYHLFARHRRQEVTLSFIGRNLILITPYSGVDPATSLFGYATAQGLDLFNTPSTRSFNFQLTVKF